MKRSIVFLILITVAIGCTNQPGHRPHFFLASYPNLEFRDSTGAAIWPGNYIQWEQINAVTTYQIRNDELILVEKETGNTYNGSVKAFHWFAYNLQADFENGKMKRLRYWHPNGELGMDLDKLTNKGSTWNEHTRLAIDWNGDKTVYYNPSSGNVREIRQGEKRQYFDNLGVMTHYRVRTDTAIWLYYADDSPRMKFPYHRDNTIRGEVRQWHPNGQLKAIGQYENNEEVGTWIGYDSLGVEIEHQIFDNGKLVEKKVLSLSK